MTFIEACKEVVKSKGFTDFLKNWAIALGLLTVLNLIVCASTGNSNWLGFWAAVGILIVCDIYAWIKKKLDLI